MSDPRVALELLSYATLMGMCVSYLLWLLPGRCRCEKCSFHVNERRVARLEADRVRVEERERQIVLRHDAEHKGWGWATGAEDRFNCADEKCNRNVAGRGENSL